MSLDQWKVARVFALAAVLASIAPGRAAFAEGAPHDPAAYVRYVNEHHGFSVDVPAFFVKKGADADGRGQIFEYDGKARIRAWGMANAPAMTAEQLFADWTRRENVTFKTLVGNTWIVRGKQHGRLFYSRSILADGVISTVEVSYDPSLADEFEPLVARIGVSLMIIPGEGLRRKGGER